MGPEIKMTKSSGQQQASNWAGVANSPLIFLAKTVWAPCTNPHSFVFISLLKLVIVGTAMHSQTQKVFFKITLRALCFEVFEVALHYLQSFDTTEL